MYANFKKISVLTVLRRETVYLIVAVMQSFVLHIKMKQRAVNFKCLSTARLIYPMNGSYLQFVTDFTLEVVLRLS